jgi:hypothetical protein
MLLDRYILKFSGPIWNVRFTKYISLPPPVFNLMKNIMIFHMGRISLTYIWTKYWAFGILGHVNSRLAILDHVNSRLAMSLYWRSSLIFYYSVRFHEWMVSSITSLAILTTSWPYGIYYLYWGHHQDLCLDSITYRVVWSKTRGDNRHEKVQRTKDN